MTTTAQKIWTEEALLALPHDGCKYELIQGELHTMAPARLGHGVVCSNIIFLLREFCRGKRLGVVLDGQTGFYMKNGDLLSPDASFLTLARWQRVPALHRKKFFRGSPDLAVEVLSPSESRTHREFKIKSYLENGTAIAWIVDPVLQTVSVRTPNGAAKTLAGNDLLTAARVLPGFSVNVADLFEDVDAA